MGKALKSKTNPHFGSKYADLDSVMGACMPALTENGICVIQPVAGEFVNTILIHESGECLGCSVPIKIGAGANPMQAFATAVTYARRYGLMCMAGIAPEDDDGNGCVEIAQPKKATDKEVSRAIDMLKLAPSLDGLRSVWESIARHVQADPGVEATKDEVKEELALTVVLDGSEEDKS